MVIFLVCRDSIDLYKHQAIAAHLRTLREDVELHILCGEPDPQKWTDKNCIYLYDGFEAYKKQHSPATNEVLHDLIMRQQAFVPAALYKADRRYFLNRKLEKELAIEQAYLVELSRTLHLRYQPHAVFMMGGGNLSRNALYLTFQNLGTKTYRILNLSLLNPNRTGQRYWLCSNNGSVVSEGESLGYAPNALDEHAKLLLADICSKNYKLDKYAKNTGRRGRTLTSTTELARALAAHLLHRPSRFAYRKKLTSLVNGMANRLLATTPKELPKPYLLFPLNVPEDAQIVLREPQFADILSACQLVANILPTGITLALKEHPGHPGMLDHIPLRSFLRENPGVRFLDATVPMSDVLPDALGIVAISSTSVLEAAINGKPAVILGSALFGNSGLAFEATATAQIQYAVTECLQRKAPPHSTIISFLARWLDQTVPAPLDFSLTEEHDIYREMALGISKKLG